METLLLDGNYLQQQSAKYISQLILKNDFITELVRIKNRNIYVYVYLLQNSLLLIIDSVVVKVQEIYVKWFH